MTDLTFRDPKSLVNRAAFNERFSILNGLYRYWWKRQVTASHWDVVLGEREDGVYFISIGTDRDRDQTIQYSSELDISELGVASLKSPKTVKYNYTNWTTAQDVLRGKYIMITALDLASSSYGPNKIWYIPKDAKFTTVETSYFELITDIQHFETKFVDDSSEPEYIFSSDRSAYPDSGEQNGYEYQFLGIPFENAREAPKIVIGSYVGTGKYGQSNPNELIFDSVPKIVILFRDNNTPTMPYYWGAPKIVIENGSSTYYCTATVSNDPVKLNFYSDNNADNQFNSNGKTYTYFALC